MDMRWIDVSASIIFDEILHLSNLTLSTVFSVSYAVYAQSERHGLTTCT